ncbi:MAG: helix-turn-helix transcriptional regulator [Flavobacteriaceae bacterium]|nr:helix-turn-helix transcriptional regulator [Flavobacteriaceae bacterium]
MNTLASFVKSRRKSIQLTQTEFAKRAGVALTVLRKIEQGKTNLSVEKVNLVLRMFGHELGGVDSRRLVLAVYAKCISIGLFRSFIWSFFTIK